MEATDSDGRFMSLVEIEDLLKWQYKHLVELDDFLILKADPDDRHSYRSIFLKDLLLFDRSFVGQTIQKLYVFRQTIGLGIFFKNRPINDMIDAVDEENKFLENFKNDYDSLDYMVLHAVETSYLGQFSAKVRHVITAMWGLIMDREHAFVASLDNIEAKKRTRQKLHELEADRIKAPKTCFLRDSYREKEQQLYEVLLEYLKIDDAPSTDVNKDKNRETITTVYHNNITTTGDGTIVSTGDYASIRASITINKGDTESLEKQLLSLGLQGGDISTLKELVQEEPTIEGKDKFGPKVGSWIHKMIGKAVDGSWQVAVGAAGGVLAEILNHFYGF